MKISHYQNITGEPGEDPSRKDSYYWNQGKFKHYIKPLLPHKHRKDMTFIDIGANNGLFCKLAEDNHFRNVIGIEADKDAVERGLAWKKTLDKPYGYNLLNKTIGDDFTFDELPLADVVLLSNVHYYFKLADWLKFIDQMYHKTEYCLIITRPIQEGNRKDWRPLTGIDAIKHYFRDWELVKARYKARLKHLEYKDDPSPRVLHSMLFRSRLRRKAFRELIPGATADEIRIDRTLLYEEYADGVPIEHTRYYKAWMERMHPKHWTQKQVYNFVKDKIKLIEDVHANGVREPVLVSADNKTIDGKHRIAILKPEGYQSIITRMI